MEYDAFMKNVETTSNNLHNINYIQGQTIYVADKQTLYLDCSDGSRIKLSDIIILNNDEERNSIQNPISDKLYFVRDTLVLWIYYNKWVDINGRCLNADTVDGMHANEFALAIHSHRKEDIPELANIKVGNDDKITVDYAEYAWDANKLNNVRFENFVTSGLRFTSDIINDYTYDKSYITETNDINIIPEELEDTNCHILYIPSTISENKSSFQLLFPFESDKIYIRYSNENEWSEWNDISDADTFQGRTVDSFANAIHTHNKNDIIDLPDKLPADGGNADTVDGKHASDFYPITLQTSSLDLDTVYDINALYVIINPCINYPPELNSTGILSVYSVSGCTKQEYSIITENKVYTRYRINNIWLDWNNERITDADNAITLNGHEDTYFATSDHNHNEFNNAVIFNEIVSFEKLIEFKNNISVNGIIKVENENNKGIQINSNGISGKEDKNTKEYPNIDGINNISSNTIHSTFYGDGSNITNIDANTINGKYANEFSEKNHKHSINDIENLDNILPADGGNADTVDGKHASDFLEYKTFNFLNDVYTNKFIGYFNTIQNNITGISFISEMSNDNNSKTTKYMRLYTEKDVIKIIKCECTETENDIDNWNIHDAIEISIKGHTHNKNDIIDLPDKLPADGGNADTVDGKHASDFIQNTIITNGDFNDIIIPGFYTMCNSTTNSPCNNNYTGLIVLKSDNDNYVEQIAIPKGTTNLYIRTCYKNNENIQNWSEWNHIGYNAVTISNKSINDLYVTNKQSFVSPESILSWANAQLVNTSKGIVSPYYPNDVPLNNEGTVELIILEDDKKIVRFISYSSNESYIRTIYNNNWSTSWLKCSDNGTANYLNTFNNAGYITDDYGNIKHTRTNSEDYLSINKNSGSNAIKLYYETGNIESTGTIKATEFIGNSTSATKLKTSVKIGEADFNGTFSITLKQIGSFPAVNNIKTDFDSLTTPGYYVVSIDEENPKPHPSSYEYYSLIVLNSTSIGSGITQQIAWQENSTNIFVRHKYGSWSKWKKLAIDKECNAKYISNTPISSIQTRDSGYAFYDQNKDWNDLKTPGYYGLMHNTSSTCHAPVTGQFFYPIILKYSDTVLTQIAIPYNCSSPNLNSVVYIRSYNNSWSEWKPLGANNFTISSSINWNSLNTGGIYHIKTTSGTNRPVTNHGTLFVENNVGNPYQLFIPDGNTNSIYKRSLSSNDWVHMGFNNYITISTTFSGTGWYRLVKCKKHNNSDNTGASGFITIQFDASNKHSCANFSIAQNCGIVDFSLLSKSQYNAGYTKYRIVKSTDGYVYIDAYIDIDTNTSGTTVISISGNGLTICNTIVSCNSESGAVLTTINTI